MSEINQREYQTVILGALLHDVGKFYQRGLGRGKGDHQQLGDECFENYFAEKLSILLSQDEIGKIRSAINNHHGYEEFITIADGLSAGFDRIALEDDETGDPLKERLQSVFQKVSLGNHNLENNYRHHLEPLSLDRKHMFPMVIPSDTSLKGEYEDLWKKFVKELNNISTSNLSFYINSLYHLLWKYTWCIPSAAYKDEPDISLFDHLKTTAAIAGCMFVKRKSDEKDEKEFLLLRGDLSGIQKFIYKIASSQGVKGVSKRLRGRSFYLSLLQDVIATYLLNNLSLSIPQLLFCGGGRLEILLPNTNAIRENIDRLSTQINKWLFKEYGGDLGLVLSWVVADRNGIMKYSDLLNDLSDQLTIKKKRKFIRLSEEDYFWLESRTSREEIRVCRSCNTTLVAKGKNEEICALCEKHNEIGEKVPKTSHIAFLSKPNNTITGVEVSFGEFGIVYLLGEYPEKYNKLSEVLLIQEINKVDSVFRFIGNTAPKVLKTFEQETEEEEDGKKQVTEGNVLTFETMADMSIGDKRIGILKMDVDYLGLIFAIGLSEKQKSISRITTLSRGMEWFFNGYLNEICKTVFEDWKLNAYKAGWAEKADMIENIFYIVYSGGDDLLIIGPWSEIPKLAQAIKNEFKAYTCNNSDINLSAGIYFCKPKFPISISAKKAGEQLEVSKNGGRNRITCFGDTVKWSDKNGKLGFDQLFDFGETLYKAISKEENKERLPRSFVHGLLRKHKQYEEGRDKNYIPAIIYQLERNVKNTAKIKTTEGEKGLKEYLKEKLITDKNGYFQKIKIPASYALLKSRKEE